MVVRVLTWNVDGLRAMLQRRHEPLSLVLKKLNADIVCFQETKVSKNDLKGVMELSTVPGWNSYFGLCRSRTSYAGVVTFCREESVKTVAAEEGLAGTDQDNVCDQISRPSASNFQRQLLDQKQLEENDNEGRAVITDHASFVLIHLYGSAETRMSSDRFPRKLTFYKTLQLRVEQLQREGRQVIIVGDLNIAKLPVDNCDWADSKLLPNELMDAFLWERPDRQWFLEFLDSSREGAPVDVFRQFHKDRRKAYTVWGRAPGKRERNFGSRVDYILVAESPDGQGQVASTDGIDKGVEGGLLGHVKGCDIMPEWKGSDHCPVWIDLDLPPIGSKEQTARPRMETSLRLKGQLGGQRRITSWLSRPQGSKRKRTADGEETPPREPLGV